MPTRDKKRVRLSVKTREKGSVNIYFSWFYVLYGGIDLGNFTRNISIMMIGNSLPHSPGVPPAPYDSFSLDGEDEPLMGDGKCSPLSFGSDSEGCSEDEDGQTPKKIRRLSESVASGDFNPDDTPLSYQKRILQEGLDALGSPDLPSPERRRHCEGLATDLVATIAHIPVLPGEKLTPKRERELAKLVKDGDPWYRRTLSHLVRIHGAGGRGLAVGSQITNWAHIENPDQNGGFHFCPPEHVLRGDLRDFFRNVETGVFSAVFKNGSGKDKRSTFFPDYFIDLADLKASLDRARVIAWKDDDKLLLVEKEGHTPFYAQSYTREGGVLVVSVFPIFFFGDLIHEDVAVLEIAGQIHSRDDLLALITDKHIKPVFTIPAAKIYDVAPFLNIPQVPKGIFIQVKRKPFNIDA